ncbi:hypothetical protein ACFSM5_08615 [Lacibacterium aquatile]|uniref:Uncharacterized protein n=1 Tax=Lacibacterium aquatile TaxID=1168082 RepID=A0ABW5DR33_9PROT
MSRHSPAMATLNPSYRRDGRPFQKGGAAAHHQQDHHFRQQ